MAADTTLTYLDAYCERAGDAGLWAEPINAATNLFFLWFAWRAIHLLRSDAGARGRTWDAWALTLLMIAIGIGSGLWHTHATQNTMLADVIPIGLFINLYIFSLFIRVIRLPWWRAALVWAVFQGASVASEMYLPRDFLNGSVMYLPTLLLLGAAVGWMRAKEHPQWQELGQIALMFVASLTFRTMDTAVCDTFPMGTHFIWHMVNAAVLFRLVRLLVVGRQMPPLIL